MNLEEAKARFKASSDNFNATARLLRPQVLFKREQAGIGELFGKMMPQDDATPPTESRLFTMKHADDCLIASHDVLYALADKVTSAIELLKYANCLDACTAELTAVVAQELRNSAKAYAPITAAFKAATTDLKDAKKRADELAQALGLTADVLNSFAKLVAVI
jgi:hypothetical protein